ncbi:hypothetical protein RZS08_46590, partial [Arthrospira platensis SPKY1]|nr:hypothetical protein [Arthrospira platensis SPKY1]
MTDVSDAGTDPNQNPIGDPENTETPNPLGENPNDPNDPTDDPTSLEIPPAPSIRVIKSITGISDPDANGVDAGDVISYSFTVTNTGNVTLT